LDNGQNWFVVSGRLDAGFFQWIWNFFSGFGYWFLKGLEFVFEGLEYFFVADIKV